MLSKQLPLGRKTIRHSSPLLQGVKKMGTVILLLFSLLLIYSPSLRKSKSFKSGEEIVRSIFAPAIYLGDEALLQFNKLNDYLSSSRYLRQNNMALKQKIILLKQQNLAFEMLRSENERLKTLLNFVESTKFQVTTARLISSSTGLYARSGIIEAGTHHNIEIGQAIVNADAVIGKVVEVDETRSVMLFITDFNSKIPVVIGPSREKAILAGNNSAVLDILYLSENSVIKEGDIIMTSGDSKYYPAGLLAAKVIKDGGKMRAIPLFDIQNIEFVSVIQY